MNGIRVDAVVCDAGVTKVAVLGVPDRPGVAARLFRELREAEVPVEMIVQSVMRGDVNDIAFLVRDDLLGRAIEVGRRMPDLLGAQGVTFDSEVCRLVVEGKDFQNCPELPAEVFALLGGRGINLEMIVATPQSLCCVVARDRSAEALALLRDHRSPCSPSSTEN